MPIVIELKFNRKPREKRSTESEGLFHPLKSWTRALKKFTHAICRMWLHHGEQAKCTNGIFWHSSSIPEGVKQPLDTIKIIQNTSDSAGESVFLIFYKAKKVKYTIERKNL